MTVPAIPRDVLLLRPALVCGNLVGLLFVGIALVRYPASTQQTILYALTLVLLAACAGVALRRARPRTATGARALRFGGAFGLLIGGCWITEVLAGNLGDVASTRHRVVYRAATLAAFGLLLLAGWAGAASTGRARDGIAVGFWSGMLSGLLTLLTLMLITYAFMGTFERDPQTVREYGHDHEQDLATFIVGDSRFAGCSHLLLIGILWGTGFGALGGWAGTLVAGRSSRRATRSWTDARAEEDRA